MDQDMTQQGPGGSRLQAAALLAVALVLLLLVFLALKQWWGQAA